MKSGSPIRTRKFEGPSRIAAALAHAMKVKFKPPPELPPPTKRRLNPRGAYESYKAEQRRLFWADWKKDKLAQTIERMTGWQRHQWLKAGAKQRNAKNYAAIERPSR